MGYCAKVRIDSHIYCVIVALFISIHNHVHCASPGHSWPSMKTYDIWGSSQNKPLHAQRGSDRANELELKDYRDKTSFRNEKGMRNTHETVLILYASILCRFIFFSSYSFIDDLTEANERIKNNTFLIVGMCASNDNTK